MKLTVEVEGLVCTVEDNSGAVDFGALCDMFMGASVGVGFHPDTVKEYVVGE